MVIEIPERKLKANIARNTTFNFDVFTLVCQS